MKLERDKKKKAVGTPIWCNCRCIAVRKHSVVWFLSMAHSLGHCTVETWKKEYGHDEFVNVMMLIKRFLSNISM